MNDLEHGITVSPDADFDAETRSVLILGGLQALAERYNNHLGWFTTVTAEPRIEGAEPIVVEGLTTVRDDALVVEPHNMHGRPCGYPVTIPGASILSVVIA